MQELGNRIQVAFENLRQISGVIRNAVKSMEKKTRIYIEKYGKHVEEKFAEAVPHGCSSKQLFCKYAANLQENTHAEV